MMKLPLTFSSLVLIAAAAIVCAYSAGPSEIQRSSDISVKDGKYTVRIKNADAKTVLTDFLNVADKEFSIDWDVNGEITERFEELDFEVALQRITRQVEATYHIQSGRYRIARRTGDIARMDWREIKRDYLLAGNDKSIDRIDIEEVDVKRAVRDLCSLAGLAVQFEQDVAGDVTLDVRSLRFDQALKLLLDQVGATYSRDSRGIWIKTRG